MDSKKFMKELIKPALGLFGCHIAGVVMAFIFCFGMSKIMQNTGGLLISMVVVLFIYSIPVYGNMWAEGYRDINREKYNHISKDMYRGFKLGALASIPAYVIAVLFILSKFNLFYNFIPLFKILNSELVPIINLIKNKPYLPDYAIWEILLIALLTVIPMLLCGVFYILGHKNFSPIHTLVYKSDNKKAKDKRDKMKK